MAQQERMEQMKKKYCFMCGEVIDGSSRFCYLCGAEQPVISKMSEGPVMSGITGAPTTDSKPLFGSWSDNILMAVDKDDRVLGSQIQRPSIKTITFVDSLEDNTYFTFSNVWDVSADRNQRVMAWIMPRTDGFYDLYIGGNGGVAANVDSRHLFSGYVNVEQIRINGKFHTDNTTDMSNMFDSCNSLTNVDVSGFNTSNVKDMGWMFAFCENLISVDVSGFDTSKVTRMSSMFWKCESLMSVDVSGFDTSNVTDMGYMFADCYKLANVDVSGFDTSNVTVMYQMFMGCESLMSVDVSGFKTSNVKSMTQMFLGCINLTNVDVSGFDTSNVTEMKWMFASCESLTSVDVSGFDTSNVTDVAQMFRGCTSLTDLDVSNFTPDQIASMDIPLGVIKPIKEESNISPQEKPKQGTKMSCAVCGGIIDRDSRFCYLCGAEQPIISKMPEEPQNQGQVAKIRCITCGGEIDSDSQFCYLCGAKLHADSGISEMSKSPEVPQPAQPAIEAEDFQLILPAAKTESIQPTQPAAKTENTQPAQPAVRLENSQPPVRTTPANKNREEKVYCKKCGSVIRSGMTFCLVCGLSQVDKRRFVSDSGYQLYVNEPEPDEETDEETKRAYCKECGTALRSGMTFCLCCGSSQVEEEEDKPKKILRKENLEKLTKANQQFLSRLTDREMSDDTEDDEGEEEIAEKSYCRECGGVLGKNMKTCFICGTRQ